MQTPAEQSKAERVHNRIDDYNCTIQAIVGFVNFYRYDDQTRTIRPDVKVFQGRHLEPSQAKATKPSGATVAYVTPDFGILLPSKEGVLGEVKISFCKDSDRWIKEFQQLMSYDDDLTGWPSSDEKASAHDIVLLVQQSRSYEVTEYCRSKLGKEITFSRRFAIVEFNRNDQRVQHFFFRKVHGALSNTAFQKRLEPGVMVPMSRLPAEYSKVKFYDSPPVRPYMIQMIWEHVVLPAAAESLRFPTLRKNQKIPVDLDIDAIVEELSNGFSFRCVQDHDSRRDPLIPKRDWVVAACEELTRIQEAEWASKGVIRVFFRRYDDVLEHFIEACAEDPSTAHQLELFPDALMPNGAAQGGRSGGSPGGQSPISD